MKDGRIRMMSRKKGLYKVLDEEKKKRYLIEKQIGLI